MCAMRGNKGKGPCTQAARHAVEAPPQLGDLPDHLLASILALATAPLRDTPPPPAPQALRLWGGYCAVSQR